MYFVAFWLTWARYLYPVYLAGQERDMKIIGLTFVLALVWPWSLLDATWKFRQWERWERKDLDQ